MLQACMGDPARGADGAQGVASPLSPCPKAISRAPLPTTFQRPTVVARALSALFKRCDRSGAGCVCRSQPGSPQARFLKLSC